MDSIKILQERVAELEAQRERNAYDRERLLDERDEARDLVAGFKDEISRVRAMHSEAITAWQEALDVFGVSPTVKILSHRGETGKIIGDRVAALEAERIVTITENNLHIVCIARLEFEINDCDGPCSVPVQSGEEG